jgi:hypothetical protein
VCRASELAIGCALLTACAGSAPSAPRAASAEIAVRANDSNADCEWRHLPLRFEFRCRSAAWAIEHEGRDAVTELAEHLRGHPEIRTVQIEGHRTLVEADLPSISLLRAEAVRDALADAGVSPTLFELEDYGDSRPISTPYPDPCPPAGEPDGGWASRRVEVSVLECDTE